MVVERKIQDFNGSTLLYLVKSRKIKLDLSKKYLLIPFKIDNIISFVPITTKQYDELLISYKKFGSLTINQYQERLTKYLFQNGEEMIVVVCLNNKVYTGGFLVALIESEDDIQHHDVTSFYNKSAKSESADPNDGAIFAGERKPA